jgi:hypothetical protein
MAGAGGHFHRRTITLFQQRCFRALVSGLRLDDGRLLQRSDNNLAVGSFVELAFRELCWSSSPQQHQLFLRLLGPRVSLLLPVETISPCCRVRSDRQVHRLHAVRV